MTRNGKIVLQFKVKSTDWNLHFHLWSRIHTPVSSDDLTHYKENNPHISKLYRSFRITLNSTKQQQQQNTYLPW